MLRGPKATTDIYDWQYCITLHLREPALICMLSQTTAVADLESQMPNLHNKAAKRIAEEERDEGFWNRLEHERVCYQAAAMPCLFPAAMCVEKKCVQEIRVAWSGAKSRQNTAMLLMSSDASLVIFWNTLIVDKIIISSKWHIKSIKGTAHMLASIKV